MRGSGFTGPVLKAAAMISALWLSYAPLSYAQEASAQASQATSAASETASTAQSDTLSAVMDGAVQPVNSTQALRKAEQSVVRVLVIYRGYGGIPLDKISMGSGFVVAPGKIVTNYHVVEVPPEASSAEIYIVPHKDTGANYQPVRLIRVWLEGDLALLESDDLKVAPLSLHLNPYKSERIVSMGYPDVTDHLLNRSGTQLLVPVDAYVTQGSIALFAATNPDGNRVDTLFHTAALSHGNSGGPLLNECGQVVGVNTWSAPSTVSAVGDVDITSGQFVATHVSALNTFLASAGVMPETLTETCYAKSEDQIIKDDALTRALAANADAQKAQLAQAAKAEADRAFMERAQLAAMIVLSILVLVLIGLIVRREIRHKEELHRKEREASALWAHEGGDGPAEARPLKLRPPRIARLPLKHPFPWGWLALGLIIVVGVTVFLVTARGVYQRVEKPKVSAAAPVNLVCEVDQAASARPIDGAGRIEFSFDATHACVSGRTPYERQANGTFLRYTLSDTEVARLEISADGKRFKRSDYRVSDESLTDFNAQRTALGSLRCVTGKDAGATEALKQNMTKVRRLSEQFLTAPPVYETVWNCQQVPPRK